MAVNSWRGGSGRRGDSERVGAIQVLTYRSAVIARLDRAI